MTSPPSSSSSSFSSSTSTNSLFTRALISGAAAGTLVDISLYPIDTLKTRLQSSRGFAASGGFRGIYAGIGSVALGSAPSGALFFVSYEWIKTVLPRYDLTSKLPDSVGHMLAASVGEVVACAVRVPTEVVKQRAQAREFRGSWEAFTAILARRMGIGVVGVWRELYRGWASTVARDVPFTVIQFPLWEGMKGWRREKMGMKEVSAGESAVFGSIAGAVAAACTTPLDVVKTRVMLAKERVGMVSMAVGIWKEEGSRGLLAGLGPRMLWISGGGFVFLGGYQFVFNALGRGSV